jgi:hypothetical protein
MPVAAPLTEDKRRLTPDELLKVQRKKQAALAK